MEELFSRMMNSLSTAVSKIEDELAKLFPEERKKLSEEQWTEYGDNLELLQFRLKQLNAFLHFEFEFEENLANDVINYTKLINEHRVNCEEVVGYLLSRTNDPWVRDEIAFLQEILSQIIENCDRISELFV